MFVAGQTPVVLQKARAFELSDSATLLLSIAGAGGTSLGRVAIPLLARAESSSSCIFGRLLPNLSAYCLSFPSRPEDSRHLHGLFFLSELGLTSQTSYGNHGCTLPEHHGIDVLPLEGYLFPQKLSSI